MTLVRHKVTTTTITADVDSRIYSGTLSPPTYEYPCPGGGSVVVARAMTSTRTLSQKPSLTAATHAGDIPLRVLYTRYFGTFRASILATNISPVVVEVVETYCPGVSSARRSRAIGLSALESCVSSRKEKAKVKVAPIPLGIRCCRKNLQPTKVFYTCGFKSRTMRHY